MGHLSQPYAAEENSETSEIYKFLKTDLDLVKAVFGTPNTLGQAKNITAKIMKTYPPEHYHYIFVGRSLTFIKVIMDNMNIPNTGLPFRGKTFDLTFSAQNAEEVKEALIKHLDQHLPRPQERQGKDLVLLDFTSSGAGLNTAQKVLDWYYNGQERLHLLKVTTNLPSIRDLIPKRLSGQVNTSKTIRIPYESMFGMHLRHSNFDSYAGYGTFNIDSGKYLDYDSHTRARYQGFRSWVAEELFSPGLRVRCARFLRTE